MACCPVPGALRNLSTTSCTTSRVSLGGKCSAHAMAGDACVSALGGCGHPSLKTHLQVSKAPWHTHKLWHEAQAYTLHSLKVALLSAAAQLRLPEESRRQQGHHRLTSVQLYSRDDTIDSLWVQSQIASALIGAASHKTCSFRTSILDGGGSDTHQYHAARIAIRAEHVRLQKRAAGPILHSGPGGLGCARSRLLQRL